MQQNQTQCLVLLFGPSFSGKSSILDCLQNNLNYMEKSYFQSAGVLGFLSGLHFLDLGNVTYKMTEIAGEYMGGGEKMKFLSFTKSRFMSNDFLIFTFRRNSRSQFLELQKMIGLLPFDLKKKFIYILGTFSDVDESEIEVSDDEARRLAQSINAQYLSFSAKRRIDLIALFHSIASIQSFVNTAQNNVDQILNYIRTVSQFHREKYIALYQTKAIFTNYDQTFRKEILTDIVSIITPQGKSIQQIIPTSYNFSYVFV